MNQALLFTETKKATAGGKSARKMIAAMVKRPGWMTRAQFAEYGINSRECRAGRRASHGRILYGQRGYILMRDATPEEISACLATTVSMINELREEYRWTARRAHGVINGSASVK